LGELLQAIGTRAEEELFQTHRASRVHLQLCQSQGRGIEIDDDLGPGIEKEKGVIRLAKEASSNFDMTICLVHEQWLYDRSG
jgi:hypothetical protein